MPVLLAYVGCGACGRVMRPGVSCDPLYWYSAGDTFPRAAYRPTPVEGGEPCHDCNTPPGGHHHAHCDTDTCPHGQALVCDVCTLAVAT